MADNWSMTELPVPSELSTIVDRIWSFRYFRQAKGPGYYRFAPEGRVDIIYVHGDLKSQTSNQSCSSGFYLCGPLTYGATIKPVCDTAIIGATINYDVAAAFVGCDLTDMRNVVLPIADSPLCDVFDNELMSCAKTTTDTYALLLSMCQLRARNTVNAYAQTKAAVSDIKESRGVLSISDLAAKQGCTVRTLQRRFLVHLGVSPKELAQIIRIRSALDIHYVNKNKSWLETCLDVGYYDQSHFIRDFRRSFFISPQDFLLSEYINIAESTAI